MMGDTVSSDVSMADAEGPGEGDGQGQAATLDDTAATAQSGTHRIRLVYPAHPLQPQGQFSEPRHHLASLPLRTSNRMSSTRHRIKSDQLSRTSLSRFSSVRRHNLPTGSTQQRCIAVACGLTMSMPGRHVTAQCARIHFAIHPLQFGPEHPHAKDYTKVAIPGLLPYLDDYIMGAHDPFVEDLPLVHG